MDEPFGQGDASGLKKERGKISYILHLNSIHANITCDVIRLFRQVKLIERFEALPSENCGFKL